MPIRTSSCLLVSLLLLGAVAPAHAQTSNGRVGGIISDPAGAAIPGAKVTARNVETGVEHATESNSDGIYLLYPLNPGTYNITAEARGFEIERVEGIQVDVGSVLTRDMHLTIGAQKQTVTVSAVATPLVTESPSVESTMVRGQIEALPLNSRNFNTLVNLAAGAVQNAYSGYDFGSVALNGNRAYGNDYMLDGVPNNNPFTAVSAAAASVDVIQEFRVISGAAPAEFGQAGAQVILVTRTGSNAFHGSAFEYHRGTTWEATNPFNPGVPAPFDNNQFGGSFGGPVVKNNTFFFFNYEGNRQSQQQTEVATVPLAPYWSGNFSALLARNITIHDPLTTAKTPFPGDIIPTSRINATALALQPYYGAPNEPGIGNNLVNNEHLTATGNQFTIRMDHLLPRNENLSFRYTQAETGGFNPSLLANGSGYQQPSHTWNGMLGWTAPLSASSVNELRLGFSDFHSDTLYFNNGLPTTASVGMVGFGPVDPTVQEIPRVTFSGNDAFTTINYGSNSSYGGSTLNQCVRTFNLADTFTHVQGTHTIKAGVDIRYQVLPSVEIGTAPGVITFASTASTSSGYSFADFLLGLPSSAELVARNGAVKLIQHQVAGYIQDDWRATRSLTLNFGLRYELSPPFYDVDNRLAMFDPSNGAIVVASSNGNLPTAYYNPFIVAKLTNASGNWVFPLMSAQQEGYPARTLIDTQYKDFGPRFGFAYNLGGSKPFVLRGGYGIFYSSYPVQNLEQILTINPPFAWEYTGSNSITNGVPALTLQAPYGTATASASGVSPGGLARNLTLPDNQQWNLTLEREIAWGIVLSVGYVGNKGTHLYRAYNANEPYVNAAGVEVRQYQSIYGSAGANIRTSDGNSIYDAMQTIVRRRIARGLLFEFNWTWAKGEDDVTTAINVNALDLQNLGRDWANSDYVRRHTIHFNGVWELPVGRGHALLNSAPRWVDEAIGGWRLSGLWSYYTGMYFTPTINSTGLSDTRPNVVYGVQANLPRSARKPTHWFNPAAFSIPPTSINGVLCECYGNAGRNILVGPGLNDADASLSKSFLFGEKRRLSFRFEIYNVFNHPSYALPDGNIQDSTAATISSIIGNMREAQFAVRFDF